MARRNRTKGRIKRRRRRRFCVYMTEEVRYGAAVKSTGEIWLNPNQPPWEFLNSAIHEVAHVTMPYASEEAVRRVALDVANILWRLGYRLKRHNRRHSAK